MSTKGPSKEMLAQMGMTREQADAKVREFKETPQRSANFDAGRLAPAPEKVKGEYSTTYNECARGDGFAATVSRLQRGLELSGTTNSFANQLTERRLQEAEGTAPAAPPQTPRCP